jgi:hypothetical protein
MKLVRNPAVLISLKFDEAKYHLVELAGVFDCFHTGGVGWLG